jgi:hypothetical protein
MAIARMHSTWSGRQFWEDRPPSRNRRPGLVSAGRAVIVVRCDQAGMSGRLIELTCRLGKGGSRGETGWG